MLAVILVLVIGTVRLIGGNANNAFSSVASSLSNDPVRTSFEGSGISELRLKFLYDSI